MRVIAKFLALAMILFIAGCKYHRPYYTVTCVDKSNSVVFVKDNLVSGQIKINDDGTTIYNLLDEKRKIASQTVAYKFSPAYLCNSRMTHQVWEED